MSRKNPRAYQQEQSRKAQVLKAVALGLMTLPTAQAQAPIATHRSGDFSYEITFGNQQTELSHFYQKPYRATDSFTLYVTQRNTRTGETSVRALNYNNQVSSETSYSSRDGYQNDASMSAIDNAIRCMSPQALATLLAPLSPALFGNAVPSIATILTGFRNHMQDSSSLSGVSSDQIAAVTGQLTTLFTQCADQGSAAATKSALYGLFGLLGLIAVPSALYAGKRALVNNDNFLEVFLASFCIPFMLCAKCCGGRRSGAGAPYYTNAEAVRGNEPTLFVVVPAAIPPQQNATVETVQPTRENRIPAPLAEEPSVFANA